MGWTRATQRPYRSYLGGVPEGSFRIRPSALQRPLELDLTFMNAENLHRLFSHANTHCTASLSLSKSDSLDSTRTHKMEFDPRSPRTSSRRPNTNTQYTVQQGYNLPQTVRDRSNHIHLQPLGICTKRSVLYRVVALWPIVSIFPSGVSTKATPSGFYSTPLSVCFQSLHWIRFSSFPDLVGCLAHTFLEHNFWFPDWSLIRLVRHHRDDAFAEATSQSSCSLRAIRQGI